MKLICMILACFVFLGCGCDSRRLPDYVFSTDKNSTNQYLLTLDKIPRELTEHFPNVDELVDGWRLAYDSQGLQSSSKIQLEQRCNERVFTAARKKFEKLQDSVEKDGLIPNGLAVLFENEDLSNFDEILVGKDLESPHLFGVILRRSKKSIVYFAVFDK